MIEVEELRAGLSMVADAVSRMAALVDERERDLAVALWREPQADVEILAHRRLGLTEDLEQLQRRIGEVDGILRSDDDNRLLAGDLEADCRGQCARSRLGGGLAGRRIGDGSKFSASPRA